MSLARGVPRETIRALLKWGQRDTTIDRDDVELRLETCYGDAVAWDGDLQRHVSEILIDRRREDRFLASLTELMRYLQAIRQIQTSIILLSEGWLLYRPDDALVGSATSARRAPGNPDRSPDVRKADLDLRRPTDGSTCTAELTRLAALDNQSRFRELFELADRSNVAISPVHPLGIATPRDEFPPPRRPPVAARGSASVNQIAGRRVSSRGQALRTIAEGTGGQPVITNDLAGGLAGIETIREAYYVLAYRPVNTRFDGRYRKIDVTVRRSGVRVQARAGYFALSAQEIASRRTASMTASGTVATFQEGFSPAMGSWLAEPRVLRGRTPRTLVPSTGDYVFSRTERIRVEWRVTGPLERHDARLLSRIGQPLSVPLQSGQSQTDGGTVLFVDILLAPLASGQYSLDLTADREGVSDRRTFGFRVTP